MKSTIAKTLRDCAYGLVLAEGSSDAVFGGEALTNSPFICDHLNWIPYGAEAKLFLAELGMPLGSIDAFRTDDDCAGYSYGPQHQLTRAWWLLFAADLAEEWGV